MTIKAATPYLFFNGQAVEAAAFYANALGGTVASLMRKISDLRALNHPGFRILNPASPARPMQPSPISA